MKIKINQIKVKIFEFMYFNTNLSRFAPEHILNKPVSFISLINLIFEGQERYTPPQINNILNKIDRINLSFGKLVRWLIFPYILTTKYKDELFLKNKKENKKSILVVARNIYPATIQKIKILKDRYIIHFVNLYDPNDQLDINSYVDYYYKDVKDYPSLKQVILNNNFDYIYILCWMWEYILAKFCIKNKKKSKIICDFYDITSVKGSKENLKKNWNSLLVDIDYSCEKFIYINSNKIIHRFNENDFKKIVKDHFNIILSKPNLEFQQYPEIYPSEKNNFYKKNSSINLLYLGGLTPRNKNHVEGLFPLFRNLEAWELILSQKINIHFYMSFYRNLEEQGLSEYIKLKEKFKNLNFHKSLPLHEIYKIKDKFDYGFLISKINMNKNLVTPYQFRAVGTKIFSYFDLELPVIMMENYTYQCEMIEENNIGIKVKTSEINNLEKKLKNVNYEKLKNSVLKFKEKNMLKKHSQRLLNFIER